MTQGRQINTTALSLIKMSEGLVLTAYVDPVGIWTIGYGHTPAEEGQEITQDEADALLAEDVQAFAQAVDNATQDATTNDNQFSAMVSLAYNIGAGAFRGSTVLRRHRAGNFGAAADAFLMWDKGHIDGKLVVISGLLKRRQRERDLYLAAIDTAAQSA